MCPHRLTAVVRVVGVVGFIVAVALVIGDDAFMGNDSLVVGVVGFIVAVALVIGDDAFMGNDSLVVGVVGFIATVALVIDGSQTLTSRVWVPWTSEFPSFF